MTFHPAARTTEISDPGSMLVEVDGRLVVLFHVDGEFFALDDVCTHDDGPLSDGQLEDHTIACPRHGAKFDIRTGAPLTMPATHATGAHEVKVDGEQVLVRLCDEAAAEGAGESSQPLPNRRAAADGSTSANAASSGRAAESDPANGAPAVAPEKAAPGKATGEMDASPPDASPPSEDRVREALKQVIDPELFVNIVDLGLIYVIEVQPDDAGQAEVKVEMTMTSPACPAGPQLLAGSKDAVSRLDGVKDVEVKLVMDPPWTPDRMTEDARDQLGIF